MSSFYPISIRHLKNSKQFSKSYNRTSLSMFRSIEFQEICLNCQFIYFSCLCRINEFSGKLLQPKCPIILNISKTDSSWNVKKVQSNGLREKHSYKRGLFYKLWKPLRFSQKIQNKYFCNNYFEVRNLVFQCFRKVIYLLIINNNRFVFVDLRKHAILKKLHSSFSWTDLVNSLREKRRWEKKITSQRTS